MRYGYKPGKIEKSVGESGFFYRHDTKVGHFPYIFLISWLYFYWYAGRSKAVCEKAGAEPSPAQNCKDYGVIYGPENHILRHVAAKFLFFLSKPSRLASTVSGEGRVFYAYARGNHGNLLES